jgi:hypothetical protein
MPSIRPRKRSAGDDDDSSTHLAQETKRMRLDSTGSPQPRPRAPPSAPDGKANPEPKAPAESIPSRDLPVASQTMRRSAELPRADSVRSQAPVEDYSHSELPTVATGSPPPSNNNTTSDSNCKTGRDSPSTDTVEGGSHGHTRSRVARHSGPAPVDPPPDKTHAQDKLGKPPSPSISTAIPEAQISPLPT